MVVENAAYSYDPRRRQEAEALVAAGYAVTVIAPSAPWDTELVEVRNGVRVVSFPPPPSSKKAVGYLLEYAVAGYRLWRLVRAVQAERHVDVVLVTAPPDFAVVLALPLARRGAGVVIDHQDLSPELFEAKFGRRGPFHWLLRRSERFAFDQADAVISTNEAYAEIARTRGGVDPDRVFMVNNAPDPGRLFPVEPRPELRRGRAALVVWIGDMSSQENLEIVIEAADELVNRRGRQDIAFALVGPGDARDALIGEAERRGLVDAVHMPGRVPDDLLRAYLSTADVCLNVDKPNPHTNRSTMTKVLEYMAVGRAVVQSPLTQMRLICGETTLYAEDSVGFADRIEELVDDPERRGRLGEAGQRRVSSGFMWRDQVPSLLAAIEAGQSRS